MCWSLQLDNFTRDLTIKKKRFVPISGSDEVCQRIKISLYHEKGEYFMAPAKGIPWYTEILGGEFSDAMIINLLKEQILLVPGVLSLQYINFRRRGRDRIVDCRVVVRETDVATREVDLIGVEIGRAS